MKHETIAPTGRAPGNAASPVISISPKPAELAARFAADYVSGLLATVPRASPTQDAARCSAFRAQMAADKARAELQARRFVANRAKAAALREANVAKVAASVARWITEAQGRDDGADLLRHRAAWVEAQLQRLSAGARLDAVPTALEGLTAADLIAARAALDAAADAMVTKVTA